MHVIPMSSLYGLKNTNQNQSPKRLSIYPKATQLINGIHPNYFFFLFNAYLLVWHYVQGTTLGTGQRQIRIESLCPEGRLLQLWFLNI